MNIFNVLFYEPIYNALIILYRLLGDNLGLAIIAIALISRFIMIPLTVRQIKMAESSREFSEKMKEIKKKYKKNKEKQQEELMKLQSQYLPAQLGGCLPMIFQFIFFIQMYRVIRNLINEGVSGFNDVAYSFVDKFPGDYTINSNFLGIVDLKESASGVGLGNTDVIPYLILIVLVGLSQYGSMRVLTAMRNKRNEKDGKNEEKTHRGKKKNKKGEVETPDFAEIMQQSTKQTMMLMPILIMFISYSLPSGLAIYWISQSSFVIIQQFIVSKLKEFRGSKETQEIQKS